MVKKRKAKKKKYDIEKYIIFILIFCLIVAIGYAVVNLDRFIQKQAPEQREIVASVNDQPIFADEVDKRLLYLQAQLGPQVTWDFVLNHSINQMLLQQEAENLGIEIDEQKIIEGVEKWLTDLQEQISPEELTAILASRNMTFDEFRNDTIEMYLDDFMVFTLFNETVFSKIDESKYQNNTVTEEEIQQYYNENKDFYESVDASHILVCYQGATRCENNRTKEEAEAKIDEVFEELRANGDFEELAGRYSDGPSATAGGRLGEFAKGQMAKEFEDAAFSLKYPNQLSDVVETEFGFHIIKLNEKKSGLEDFRTEINIQIQLTKQEESQQKIRKIQEIELGTYIEELRKGADIVYYTANPHLSQGITPTPGIMTFSMKEGDICTEDGKPIIRLFSSTTCPHCTWIEDTYDSMMKELVEEGLIVAYHWKMDIEDDSLTSIKEDFMPQEEKDLYYEFNPRGSVPTFVFGCKYYRVGNGYEAEGNLALEKREFLAIIEELKK